MSRKIDTLSGSPRRENGTPSRRDHYRELLIAKRIPQRAQRWYVTQVLQFLGLVQPNSLKGISADEMTGYLRQTSSLRASGKTGSSASWWMRCTCCSWTSPTSNWPRWSIGTID